jgi:pyruvate kinase
MLSGETAAGRYPAEAVKTMAKIAETTENHGEYVRRFRERRERPHNTNTKTNTTDAVSHAAVSLAPDLGTIAIVTVTKSGSTARNLSKFRPDAIIIGCTPSVTALRQMAISWGVYPVMMEEKASTDELLESGLEAAKSTGILEKGDIAVITAGIPLGVIGNTNMLKVATVD